jgi:hypothetical protein
MNLACALMSKHQRESYGSEYLDSPADKCAGVWQDQSPVSFLQGGPTKGLDESVMALS